LPGNRTLRQVPARQQPPDLFHHRSRNHAHTSPALRPPTEGCATEPLQAIFRFDRPHTTIKSALLQQSFWTFVHYLWASSIDRAKSIGGGLLNDFPHRMGRLEKTSAVLPRWSMTLRQTAKTA
jgi:hypothetical protein